MRSLLWLTVSLAAAQHTAFDAFVNNLQSQLPYAAFCEGVSCCGDGDCCHRTPCIKDFGQERGRCTRLRAGQQQDELCQGGPGQADACANGLTCVVADVRNAIGLCLSPIQIGRATGSFGELCSTSSECDMQQALCCRPVPLDGKRPLLCDYFDQFTADCII